MPQSGGRTGPPRHAFGAAAFNLGEYSPVPIGEEIQRNFPNGRFVYPFGSGLFAGRWKTQK